MEVDYDTAKRKVSKKFKRMCEVYKFFSRNWSHLCDYSEESMIEMYTFETYGIGNPDTTNGYFLGKKWMGVTIGMWLEDLPEGYVLSQHFKNQLYDDPDLPNWWLDKVLKQY